MNLEQKSTNFNLLKTFHFPGKKISVQWGRIFNTEERKNITNKN